MFFIWKIVFPRRYDGDTDSRFPQLTILEADSDEPMGIINWYF